MNMVFSFVFFLLVRPRLISTLFPYTTLFRSWTCPASVLAKSSWSPRYSIASNIPRSEEHTSELQSQFHLVCRLLLDKKKSPITGLFFSPCQSGDSTPTSSAG